MSIDLLALMISYPMDNEKFFFPTFTAEFGWLCPFFGWVWMGVTFYGIDVGECGRIWVTVTFFGWVWANVGECDLFLAGCGWMWVSGLLLTGCGWVWVSVTFFWLGVGRCG